jgi:hypothetical protein
MEFADLRRTGFYAYYVVHFITNKGVDVWLDIEAYKGHWAAGETHMEIRDRVVNCRVYRTIDYAKNVVVIGIARKCVGRPRWVRMAAYSDASELESPQYYDDAATRDLIQPWHEHIGTTLTPRLDRGSSR